MRHSKLIQQLKQSRRTLPHKLKAKHVGELYSKLKHKQPTINAYHTLSYVQALTPENTLMEDKLEWAQQYIDTLQQQTLNYQLYIKTLSLTSDQLNKTRKLAEQIRRNEQILKEKKRVYQNKQNRQTANAKTSHFNSQQFKIVRAEDN